MLVVLNFLSYLNQCERLKRLNDKKNCNKYFCKIVCRTLNMYAIFIYIKKKKT